MIYTTQEMLEGAYANLEKELDDLAAKYKEAEEQSKVTVTTGKEVPTTVPVEETEGQETEDPTTTPVKETISESNGG